MRRDRRFTCPSWNSPTSARRIRTRRREEAAAETGPTPSYPDDRGSRAWDVLGLLALAAALVSLEARQPYYFTQDDALVVEAPSRLVGCRSLWQGQFPEYNPYNMFGEPMASTGCGSFTYPPTYMAYAAARHLLGNEYLVGDVFVVLHLVAGFAAMRWFCGELGLRRATANLAGLSFVLSGSFLIMGRSWTNFVPMVVWLPVLGWGVLRWTGDRWAGDGSSRWGLRSAWPSMLAFPRTQLSAAGSSSRPSCIWPWCGRGRSGGS